jgi:hypothetical protein
LTKLGWAEVSGSKSGVEGAVADLMVLGSNKMGQKGVDEREKKEKVFFSDFEKQQTNEFKHKFEFKHSKAMHQHVCNIKLI